MRHMYVFTGIDADKSRADAMRISLGDNRNPPDEVLLHMHSSTQACSGRHLYYHNGKVSEDGHAHPRTLDRKDS